MSDLDDAPTPGEERPPAAPRSSGVRIDAEGVTGQHAALSAADLFDREAGAGSTAPPPPSPGAPGSGRGRSGRDRRAAWRRTERDRRREARRSVRFPILTRSILLWWLVFAIAGVAFGASGAFWWANFDSQVSDLRRDTQDFEARSTEAQKDIGDLRQQAIDDIDDALAPLQGFLSENQMLQLAATYAPSVTTVATLDEAGQASVGTGFAVISDERQTWFVTSYQTIRAATTTPGPQVFARHGSDEMPAEVWSWDPVRDLALLRVARGGVPVLEWAEGDVMAKALGSRVFPVSGLGGAGASLTTGMVIDQSAAGIQHTAPVGAAFRGGPMVNTDGKVVAVASLDYRPLGFDPGPQIHFATPVTDVCRELISCGSGSRTAGPRG